MFAHSGIPMLTIKSNTMEFYKKFRTGVEVTATGLALLFFIAYLSGLIEVKASLPV